jgi:hypothetical protein
MTTNSNTQPTNDKPASQPGAPLFEPFPEPQGWPKHWDVSALEELSRPKPGKPDTKPQA